MTTLSLRIPAIIKNSANLLTWKTSLHFKSPPGVGKSQMVGQIGKIHNRPVLTYMLANATPPDVPGYTIPTVDGKGRTYSNNALPYWSLVQTDGSVCDADITTAFDVPNCIIFFDEFLQAEGDVQKASAPVILERRVGRHTLPPDTRVWLASNRASDRSGVGRQFDHIINRTCEINVEGHPEDLAEWMAERNYPSIFRSYVLRRPNIVFGGIPKEQRPFCTPRSFVAACDFLMCTAATTGDHVEYAPTAFDMTILSGTMGDAEAADLQAFLRLHDQLPSKREVLDYPDTAKLPSGMDGQMVVVQMLAFDVTADTAPAIVTYVKRMSPDMAVTFIKTAVRKNPDLLNTKAVTSWVTENHSLLAAVAALS